MSIVLFYTVIRSITPYSSVVYRVRSSHSGTRYCYYSTFTTAILHICTRGTPYIILETLYIVHSHVDGCDIQPAVMQCIFKQLSTPHPRCEHQHSCSIRIYNYKIGDTLS